MDWVALLAVASLLASALSAKLFSGSLASWLVPVAFGFLVGFSMIALMGIVGHGPPTTLVVALAAVAVAVPTAFVVGRRALRRSKS